MATSTAHLTKQQKREETSIVVRWTPMLRTPTTENKSCATEYDMTFQTQAKTNQQILTRSAGEYIFCSHSASHGIFTGCIIKQQKQKVQRLFFLFCLCVRVCILMYYILFFTSYNNNSVSNVYE